MILASKMMKYFLPLCVRANPFSPYRGKLVHRKNEFSAYDYSIQFASCSCFLSGVHHNAPRNSFQSINNGFCYNKKIDSDLNNSDQNSENSNDGESGELHKVEKEVVNTDESWNGIGRFKAHLIRGKYAEEFARNLWGRVLPVAAIICILFYLMRKSAKQKLKSEIKACEMWFGKALVKFEVFSRFDAKIPESKTCREIKRYTSTNSSNQTEDESEVDFQNIAKSMCLVLEDCISVLIQFDRCLVSKRHFFPKIFGNSIKRNPRYQRKDMIYHSYDGKKVNTLDKLDCIDYLISKNRKLRKDNGTKPNVGLYAARSSRHDDKKLEYIVQQVYGMSGEMKYYIERILAQTKYNFTREHYRREQATTREIMFCQYVEKYLEHLEKVVKLVQEMEDIKLGISFYKIVEMFLGSRENEKAKEDEEV